VCCVRECDVCGKCRERGVGGTELGVVGTGGFNTHWRHVEGEINTLHDMITYLAGVRALCGTEAVVDRQPVHNGSHCQRAEEHGAEQVGALVTRAVLVPPQ
jgi:hypothetical protein